MTPRSKPPEDAPSHLFVYGTLRRDHDHPMARQLAAGAAHIGRGIWRGRLYDLGPFPAAVATAGGTDVDHVVGDVYHLEDPGVLVPLDEYERLGPGAEALGGFVREPHRVLLDDGRPLSVWLYRYTGPFQRDRRIVGGDYVKHRATREAAPA